MQGAAAFEQERKQTATQEHLQAVAIQNILDLVGRKQNETRNALKEFLLVTQAGQRKQGEAPKDCGCGREEHCPVNQPGYRQVDAAPAPDRSDEDALVEDEWFMLTVDAMVRAYNEGCGRPHYGRIGNALRVAEP